jgi:superfamily II DNA or RNA helicase
MDEPLTVASAQEVRSLIAQRYLGAERSSDILGKVHLRPHQVEAVSRLRALLRERRCALLADEVGLGKTYVALALAGETSRTLLVAPGGLRDMWKKAIAETGAGAIDFVSHEEMSLRPMLGAGHDLVIVDEAHHARNPATRRYGSLADHCRSARVLLLSATPVHNSERDLRSLFALALGSRAWSMDLDELLGAIVRREHHMIAGVEMPVAEPAEWLSLPHDDCILEAIVNLPPPLPPGDGGDAGALLVHGLARQWASSRHALVRALSRRRAKALALIAALEAGRYPSRDELRSWVYAEDTLQLGFPELLAAKSSDAQSLLPIVKAHEVAVGDLVVRLRAGGDVDDARAERLRELQHRHPNARIVAFTQFADTATSLYRLLRDAGRVAMLTAQGGITPGGPMSRRDILARFSPARGEAISAAEDVRLLLTTDLLSEGVDLPDVSVVVHLDLPWTPARLEQRVGRALRLTSRHQRVSVYCMSPPASAETLIRVEEIIRRKLKVAAKTVGVAGSILPAVRIAATDLPAPPHEAVEAVRARFRQWQRQQPDDRSDSIVAGAVRSNVTGWIAIVEDERGNSLVGCRNGTILEAAADRSAMIGEAEGPDVSIDPAALEAALQALRRWLDHRSAASDAAISIAPGARSGLRLLRRIGAITSRAPAHRRAVISNLALHARHAVLATRGIAGERVLAELVDSPLPDEAWLLALGTFGTINGDHEKAPCPPTGRILALLLLQEA